MTCRPGQTVVSASSDVLDRIAYLDAESLPEAKLVCLIGGIALSIGKESDPVSPSF